MIGFWTNLGTRERVERLSTKRRGACERGKRRRRRRKCKSQIEPIQSEWVSLYLALLQASPSSYGQSSNRLQMWCERCDYISKIVLVLVSSAAALLCSVCPVAFHPTPNQIVVFINDFIPCSIACIRSIFASSNVSISQISFLYFPLSNLPIFLFINAFQKIVRF